MIQSKYYSVKTHFGSYRGTDWKHVTSAPRTNPQSPLFPSISSSTIKILHHLFASYSHVLSFLLYPEAILKLFHPIDREYPPARLSRKPPTSAFFLLFTLSRLCLFFRRFLRFPCKSWLAAAYESIVVHFCGRYATIRTNYIVVVVAFGLLIPITCC